MRELPNLHVTAPKGYVDFLGKFLWLIGTRTITDHLNMGIHSIKNVANPVDTQDATTKDYEDSCVSSGRVLWLNGYEGPHGHGHTQH